MSLSKRFCGILGAALTTFGLCLGLGSFCPKTTYASTATTPKDRIELMDYISSKYEVGDVLTPEDAELVRQASAASQNVRRDSKSVNETRTAYGTTALMCGNVWHNGTFNYNFGGNLTGKITAGSTPKSMTLTVRCQSYGLVGGSTVLTYDDSVSQTSSNSKSVSMNKSKDYSGVAAIYIINTSLDVTTANGQGFTVNAQ